MNFLPKYRELENVILYQIKKDFMLKQRNTQKIYLHP